MTKYYLMAIERNCDISMFNLGYYYHIQGDYVNMLKYYHMAIDQGCAIAMCNLALYYQEQTDYINMSKYFLMSINKGWNYAMHCYGYYFDGIKDYDNTTRYYLMAIENGYDTSIDVVFEFFDNNNINKGITIFNDLHKKGIKDIDKYLAKLLPKSNTSLLEYVKNKQIIEKQLDAMKEEMEQMKQYIIELEFAPKLIYKN
jgi:TPR repeat protein